MLELLPKGIEIKFEDGHPRQLYFSIRVIYTLQEMYDKPIEKVLNEELLQTEDKYGALVKILKVLLDDDVRRQKKYQGKDIPELSEEYLLDILDDDACRELMLAIIKAFNGGLPKSEGDPAKKRGERAIEKINIARMIYIGKVLLNYPEDEVWEMTLGKLTVLYREHKREHEHGLLEEQRELTIDDVVPY